MANFTITTANFLTTGTPLSDQFTVNTSLGVTVEGGAGDDQILALATNFTNAQLFGGQGNDSIYLTAAAGTKTLNGSLIAAGAGKDLIVVDTGVGTNASILGGGGNDTIQFRSGSFAGGAINGNQGNDLITASVSRFVSALIGAGGGDDTIRFDAGTTGVGSTINGGGGNDLLAFSGVTFKSGTRIEGDTLGESQFFGNDSINLGAGIIGSGSTINGGQGNDVISVDGAISTGLTVEGNQGEDSIFLTGTLADGATFLGGGAGQDTITVSAALATDFGTIQGGGGVDVINVSGVGGSGGFIFGGAGADTINLGTFAAGRGNLTTVASGVNVAYSAFSESNFAAFDTISAGVAATGAFMINQSVVNFAAVASGINGAGSTEFTTNTGAVVDAASFTATRTTLTARAEALDANLTQGQAVVFDVAGQNYLFVQGGAAVSGLTNDMLVELGMAFEAASGGLAVVNNSQLKVAFE